MNDSQGETFEDSLCASQHLIKGWSYFPTGLEVTLSEAQWATIKRGCDSVASSFLLAGQLCKLAPIDRRSPTFCFEALGQAWFWICRFCKPFVYSFALRHPVRSWVWIVHEENTFPIPKTMKNHHYWKNVLSLNPSCTSRGGRCSFFLTMRCFNDAMFWNS